MQNRRDAEQEGHRTARMQDSLGYKTGKMQEMRDAGKEVCRTGGMETGRMQYRKDAGQEGFRTCGMQNRYEAGQV